MNSFLKLKPTHKDYIWGGEKLKEIYDDCREMNIVAESWVLSSHKDGENRILDGEFAGCGFSEYLKKVGKDVLGENMENKKDFPILIKFIDAKKDLSIQVHPDDEYALLNEGQNGKTEMWYILDCEPGACIYYGFKKNVSREEARDAIENGTFTDLLNSVPVHKGDAFFIPAGMVHAIGAGAFICEIQQNSNVTYRVYDYNRTDKDGNKRELHIEKALDTMNLERTEIGKMNSGDVLTECNYFKVVREKIESSKEIMLNCKSFLSVIVTEGCGKFIYGENISEFKKGDSFFFPAEDGNFRVEGDGELILTTV